MNELLNDVMEEIEGVVNESFGCRNPISTKLIVLIKSKIAIPLTDAQDKIDEADELEDRLEEAEYECKEAEDTLEEEQRDIEWERMVAMFWHNSEVY